jgi:hypothetical protein
MMATLECFVRSMMFDQVCFCLECQQVDLYGGTIGNLTDHQGRTKHLQRVAERNQPPDDNTLAARVAGQLAYCAFHGYAFDHMEKRETIAAMRCPYRLTSEVAARLCTLAGLDTQEAIIQEVGDQDLLYAGVLSDGWSRQHGGKRFIGTVIRTWSSDAVLIERTFGLRVVDDLVGDNADRDGYPDDTAVCCEDLQLPRVTAKSTELPASCTGQCWPSSNSNPSFRWTCPSEARSAR